MFCTLFSITSSQPNRAIQTGCRYTILQHKSCTSMSVGTYMTAGSDGLHQDRRLEESVVRMVKVCSGFSSLPPAREESQSAAIIIT